MLLHGVLRGFWDHALQERHGIITRKQKQIIRGRQPGVVTTSDFNRRYSDIVLTYKTWTLYDWLTFADVWFYFICKDLKFTANMPPTSKFGPTPEGVTRATNFT